MISNFSEVISKYRDKISKSEKDLEVIETQEKEESYLRATENQMNKAKKLLEREKNGMDDQKRSWFQTHKERMQEKGKYQRPKYLHLRSDSSF